MALPPLTSYHESMMPPPLGTGCCVFWFYPCAYGMLVDMNMDNKVLSGHTNTDIILSIVCASALLSSCPSDRVAGGGKHALRQLRRVLHVVRRIELLPVRDLLRYLWHPHINPKQAQPEGARHLSVWPLEFPAIPAVY